ncbi:MAG: beta-galactosidase [Planctomycetota bacterium]|nr:beta-galactosidase [Planctomycetota bacterium]
MASVTYDGQSFFVERRRVWVLGASIEYARVPPEAWPDRIAAAKQAGFNTIETSCPWLLHEPRKGRFSFHDHCDVRRFVELCAAAGMWVLLRPGPYVGGHYDAGGLPSWLIEMPNVVLREANEPFLGRVSLYFRKLFAELADLQATSGGPILLVQSEHAWLCSNRTQADRYLREVSRYIRENGINVPIINANDLWQESVGTIDTWRGFDDLLVHLRQLRSVQSNAPCLVSAFDPVDLDTWGGGCDRPKSPEVVLHSLAQVLAAGAQPVVSPFHGGTNFGFLGGRAASGDGIDCVGGGFVTTSAAASAPLGEAGARGPKYNAIKRLISFANHFSHVFADLDEDYHPISRDLSDVSSAARRRGQHEPGGRSGSGVAVLPLRGAAGRVVFVFADRAQRDVTLLLEQGIRMPVALGDQSVGWYVLDVDLRGSGRLDYANLCPFAIVDRSILVLQGPADAPVYLSINGSPLQATVPRGGKPLLLQHKRITIVVCNQQQIDATYHNDTTVFVGVAGLDREGSPLPAKGSTSVWEITKDAGLQRRSIAPAKRAPRPIGLVDWQAAPAVAYTTGESPRYATLDGPDTLNACGAGLGYGWYRIGLRVTSSRKRRCHLPQAADRVHLFINGTFGRLVGVAPGADHRPFDLKLAKGQHTIVALVDNLGRFSDGNDLAQRKGLFGHFYEVKRLGAVRPKKTKAPAVDPFALRGYIAGRTFGQLSDTNQVVWTFTHARKSPILLDLDGAGASGTIVLNNEPVAYYCGASGGSLAHILLDPTTTGAFRRGRNVLRFAPDSQQDGAVEQILKAATLYECVTTITASAAWAFAKWEPPSASAYAPISRNGTRNVRGVPCWWRTSFTARSTAGAMWFDTSGLSKGQAYLNGKNLGRYFTATAAGHAVGPQRRLYVPAAWVTPGQPNELVLFDEHGFAPHRTRIVFSATGPLE